MLRPAADENFNSNIVRVLLRRRPDLNILRVQDVGLAGADDPAVLSWAAGEGRILLTHDIEAMVGFAYGRVEAGLRMPGVFEVRLGTPIDKPSKISCCWRSIALTMNGKGGWLTFRPHDFEVTFPAQLPFEVLDALLFF